jgi:cell wall assembly regulator SMI1
MTDTSLAELDATLRSARPEFHAKLRPGVDESALDSFEAYCGQALPVAFRELYRWRAGWIPFAANGGGSYLCVDLRAEDGGTPDQVIEFWKADHDRPVVHTDLSGWIAHVVVSTKVPGAT